MGTGVTPSLAESAWVTTPIATPPPWARLAALGYDRLADGPERRLLGGLRHQLLASARGRTLDLGAGTGANLPHYPVPPVTQLVLVDRSAAMLTRARERARRLSLPVELLQGRAERLALPSASIDTAVVTLALCTIESPDQALQELRRVLRRDGRLLVLEHVRAADPALARWQDRLAGPWRLLAAGCHPNRDTRGVIEAAGFRFESISLRRHRGIPLAILQPLLVGLARDPQPGPGATG